MCHRQLVHPRISCMLHLCLHVHLDHLACCLLVLSPESRVTWCANALAASIQCNATLSPFNSSRASHLLTQRTAAITPASVVLSPQQYCSQDGQQSCWGYVVTWTPICASKEHHPILALLQCLACDHMSCSKSNRSLLRRMALAQAWCRSWCESGLQDQACRDSPFRSFRALSALLLLGPAFHDFSGASQNGKGQASSAWTL